MGKRIQSFSARLSVNVLVFSSLLFLAAILVVAVSSHTIIASESTKTAQALLNDAISQIEKRLEGVESTVKGAVWTVSENLDAPDHMYDITRKVIEADDNIVGSAIAFSAYYYPDKYYYSPYSFINESGEVESKQLGTDKYDYFTSEWYAAPVQKGEPCWSEPYFDEGGGQMLMSTYSYPIIDENGMPVAVMTADISLSWISDLLAGIKPYKSSAVSLVTGSGAFISIGAAEEFAGKNLITLVENLNDNTKGVKELAEAIMSGESGVRRYSRGARTSFAVFGPLSNGWRAYMTCDYKEVLARSTEMHVVLMIIGLLGLFALFLILYNVIRVLTRPLVEMSDAALSVAQGNFNTTLPELHYDDEIKQLRDSLEVMQHSLTDYIDNLKSTTAAKERIESELNIASSIQMAMLRKDFPHNDLVDLYAGLKPAKEVGGDLYDFFIKDDRLYFTVGDVSGKGVPASMFMAITRAAVRFILDMGLPLSEVMEKVNDAICDGNDSGMFVTLFIGCISLSTGEFRYCNAGHNPIVVNGAFLPVIPNLAVGVWQGYKYQEQSTTLEKGSKLLIYTDGVTEAERADKLQFGEERLLEWANNENCNDAETACKNLVEKVREFTDGNEQNDDITIMTIKLC